MFKSHAVELHVLTKAEYAQVMADGENHDPALGAWLEKERFIRGSLSTGGDGFFNQLEELGQAYEALSDEENCGSFYGEKIRDGVYAIMYKAPRSLYGDFPCVDNSCWGLFHELMGLDDPYRKVMADAVSSFMEECRMLAAADEVAAQEAAQEERENADDQHFFERYEADVRSAG